MLCKWSQASTFSYNRNAISLAVANASAIRTHLSVHGTAHPISAASIPSHPRSAADCLIRSAVDISHPRQQGNPPASSFAASGPVGSDMINGLGAGTGGRGGNPSLFPSMTTGVVPGSVDSASAPLSSGRGNYLPTQSQASYRSTSSSPSACCPSSGFDVDNEEADLRANVTVVDGHADIRASAVMTDDEIDNEANENGFNDTYGEALGASFRATSSHDLEILFGAVDFNVNLHRTPLLSLLPPLPPPLVSPPPSAAAEEPI